MTVTSEELQAHVDQYQAQYRQATEGLQQLEQNYHHQKQELTTTLAMCAGAVQAFEQLIANLKAAKEEDTDGGQ